MDLKDITENIKLLESDIAIDKLTYSDFNAWPYVRLKIVQKLSCSSEGQKQVPKKKRHAALFRLMQQIFLYIRNPVIKKEFDIVYFSRTSESQDIIDNKLFNRYSDTLREFFSKTYRIKTLEAKDVVSSPRKKRYNPEITNLDFPITMLRNKFAFRKKCVNIPDHFHIINTVIKKNLGFELDLKEIEEELCWLEELANFYEGIIKNYNPKLVFLVCFYRLEAMAVSLACSRLNIKSVEYQHGAQNDVHPMYTNWNNIPVNGYELLPDVFWMWGEKSCQRIDVWTRSTLRHKTVIGGNLWLSYRKKHPILEERREISFRNDRTKILVTLQGDQVFPGFLIQYLKLYGNEHDWFFRDHPRQPISAEMKTYLNKFSFIDIDTVSEMDLYTLLNNIDIHITGYSTVAFEAQSFNVPTIFTHENAEVGYSDLLNNDGLFYAKDAELIKEIISKISRRGGNIVSRYITPDIMPSVLDNLIHGQ